MSGEGPGILIIEDDAAQAALLEEFLMLLGPSGVVVHTAGRLADGLDLLDREPIDVVVTDLSLPDSVGAETVTRLLDRAPGKAVVVMSGRGEDALAAEVRAVGARDYLLKGHVDYPQVVRRVLAAAADDPRGEGP